MKLIIRDCQGDILTLIVKTRTIGHLNMDMANLRAISFSFKQVIADVDFCTRSRSNLDCLIFNTIKYTICNCQLTLNL